jgi:ribosomal protein L11 methyltransferase
MRALVSRLEETFPAGLETVCTMIEQRDWATRWRDGLGTRRIGRLVIAPSWIQPEVAPTERRVVIDPEGAFGSGEHGSTRAALRLLERHLRPGEELLDLGTGSGILAIAAALAGAGRSVGIDHDPDAIGVAEGNARRNGVDDRVVFVCGDARDLSPLLGPADVIASNILQTINSALLPTIRRALLPAGRAIFSGMEQEEAEEFRVLLNREAFDPIDEDCDAGWWAVAARCR